MKTLANAAAALLFGFSTSSAVALVSLDPADFTPGSNVSNAFAGVELSNVEATADVVGVVVISPLREVPGTPTPIYAFGESFSNDSTRPRTWFSGIALRVDFDFSPKQVSVLFLPDDIDTGLLSIFGPSGEALADLVARSSAPFTLTFSASGTPIAYALASYGDAGNIGRIQYEAPEQVSEPATFTLLGLGLVGIVASRRRWLS